MAYSPSMSVLEGEEKMPLKVRLMIATQRRKNIQARNDEDRKRIVQALRAPSPRKSPSPKTSAQHRIARIKKRVSGKKAVLFEPRSENRIFTYTGARRRSPV